MVNPPPPHLRIFATCLGVPLLAFFCVLCFDGEDSSFRRSNVFVIRARYCTHGEQRATESEREKHCIEGHAYIDTGAPKVAPKRAFADVIVEMGWNKTGFDMIPMQSEGEGQQPPEGMHFPGKQEDRQAKPHLLDIYEQGRPNKDGHAFALLRNAQQLSSEDIEAMVLGKSEASEMEFSDWRVGSAHAQMVIGAEGIVGLRAHLIHCPVKRQCMPLGAFHTKQLGWFFGGHVIFRKPEGALPKGYAAAWKQWADFHNAADPSESSPLEIVQHQVIVDAPPRTQKVKVLRELSDSVPVWKSVGAHEILSAPLPTSKTYTLPISEVLSLDICAQPLTDPTVEQICIRDCLVNVDAGDSVGILPRKVISRLGMLNEEEKAALLYGIEGGEDVVKKVQIGGRLMTIEVQRPLKPDPTTLVVRPPIEAEEADIHRHYFHPWKEGVPSIVVKDRKVIEELAAGRGPNVVELVFDYYAHESAAAAAAMAVFGVDQFVELYTELHPREVPLYGQKNFKITEFDFRSNSQQSTNGHHSDSGNKVQAVAAHRIAREPNDEDVVDATTFWMIGGAIQLNKREAQQLREKIDTKRAEEKLPKWEWGNGWSPKALKVSGDEGA